MSYAWAAVMRRLANAAAGQPIPSLLVDQVLRTDRLGTESASDAIYLQPAALHEGLNNSNQLQSWESLLVSYSSLAAIS